ncbi:hypothetical protein RHSIM_Rhsim02G0127300 [Rhododendron simsii]|uniref:Aminotransferase-like plant mobile domain-containing protein n=1 Tax=Rhododendron simsii TaxID=118357 RepID=A0A834HDP0_RHOSS|nr:hypothetical protein RHSIM_Rhsim02G0127300 [Rhododendron simsii]
MFFKGEPPIDYEQAVIRRNEASLKRLDPPMPPVLALIRHAGFGGLIDLSFMSLDLALMTALMERWRPETHSFHLGTREWTITLQDVEILLRVPVDGEAVIGRVLQKNEWGPLCNRLLGVVSQEKLHITGVKVLMPWLREHFTGQLPIGYTDEDVRRQARGYILQLIGGILMLDHSGSHVHLACLTLLEDFTLAWVRFPYVALGRKGWHRHPPGSPLGARWHNHFHSPDLATHVLGAYRHYFDMQKPDEVVWRPYSEELIASLPHNCCDGRAIWTAKVPLLNFPMVQMHMPDRVKRQFGFRQTIPDPCNRRQLPHGKDWKAGHKEFSLEHHAQLQIWNNRLEHVLPDGEADPHAYAYPPDDPYVLWYERITLRYVSRLGGAVDMARKLFERLRMMEVVDLDVIQNIGSQRVGCLGYLEKWLRKRPPMEPIPPPEEGVTVGDEAEPPTDHENEAQNVGQEPVQPNIGSDAISEQVDPGTSVSLQQVEGAGVSSLAAHLGSLENFPLSPFLSYFPCMAITQSPLDSQWFDSAVANIGLPDICFVHRPTLKRRKTSHVDGVGRSAAHAEVTLSRDDLLGSGHSTALQVEVQAEAEGDGVVSSAV